MPIKQRKQQEAKQMIDRIRNQQEKLDKLRNETSGKLHLDSDGDGITDIEERIKGTSPYSIDTDWDGHTDLEEVNRSTNPRISETDKQHSPPASDYLETELEL